MPVFRVPFSLLVLGSLGLTAISVSSLLPAGPAPAAESPPGAPATLARPVHDRLLHFRSCLQKTPFCSDFIMVSAERSAHQKEIVEAAPQVLLQNPAANRSTPARQDTGLPIPSAGAAFDPDPARDGDRSIWPAAEWSRHTLREGEHLTALWNSHWGLRLRTLFQLGSDPENARLLDVVHPGQKIEWQTDAAGGLKRLRLWTDRARGHEWVRLEGTEAFTRVEISTEREVGHRVLQGKVRGSVVDSLREEPGLVPATARAIGVLLGNHLPPGEEMGSGDRYTLLLEIERLAGDDTPYDIRVLAFELSRKNGILTAVRHADGRFYTPEGQPLLPPFDRHPFEGEYRMTSGFSDGRRHPVTGRVAPHNGTDFAMPVGAPILAPADGRVTRVEHHPLAGRLLMIEHGQGFSTRYLHLQKALVQPGQRVRRGQRIALSGNSGRTTSAHLHYELHIDGRAVDPMRVQLPRGAPLSGAELARFQRTAQPLLLGLAEAAAPGQLAMQPLPGTGL
ncbi:MAG: peptidoglycan DD-metalloendopeptidase family protein [Pseudomonadota bacterium]